MVQQLNLFNASLEARREWITLITSAACWVLVAVVAAAWAAWSINEATTVAAQERVEKAQLSALQTEVTAKAAQATAMKRDAAIDAELNRLEAELRAREEILNRLNSGVIGNTTGYSEHLRAFARQSLDGMWLTGFHILGSGHDITLEGRALRPELVPNYLRRLNRERSMKGHGFAQLVMERPAAITKPAEKDQAARIELPSYVDFRITSVLAEARSKGQTQ